MSLDKTQLSERDICTKFILPALEQAGWDRQSQLYEEYPLRVGRVVVRGNRWFFVFGFEKSERANIGGEELEELQDIAADLLARTGRQLEEAIADGALVEICHDCKNEGQEPHS